MELRHAYLIRHARARLRADWDGRDSLRPLIPAGWHQAAGIATNLGHRVERVVTSPAIRCVDTVLPLARTAEVRLEYDPAFAPGRSAKRALAIMCRMRVESAAFCSHGDVIEGILGELDDQDVRLIGGARLAKGSAWRLDIEHGAVVAARYIPPPS